MIAVMEHTRRYDEYVLETKYISNGLKQNLKYQKTLQVGRLYLKEQRILKALAGLTGLDTSSRRWCLSYAIYD